jgi:hypothetical protein
MAATKTLAALTALGIGTACVPSSASAQSFIADLIAAPFYIAGASIATAGAIVAGPYYNNYYYGYPVYGYPAYGYAYAAPIRYAYAPPGRYAYAGPAPYTYGPVTTTFGPPCGYDPWGRWACPVR